MTTLGAWEIQDWLIGRIAEKLELALEEVPPDAILSDLGLSSVQAVELAADLEDWSGRTIPATFVYECPTVADAAVFVAALPASGGRAA